MNRKLKVIPKLNENHVKLNPYSVMKVNLATQVLSASTANILNYYYPGNTDATAEFCRYMDKFFDCLNVRNQYEGDMKNKEFLKPYRDINDERFLWLKDEFLPYLQNWKECTENRPGNFTENARTRMFLPWQTHESLKITTHSVIRVVKFLLLEGMPFVLTERLNQDCLEEYFGKHRALGRRNDNPDLRQFGYQSNTIRIQRSVAPVTGNTKGAHKQKIHVSWSEVDNDPVPKRKKCTT